MRSCLVVGISHGVVCCLCTAHNTADPVGTLAHTLISNHHKNLDCKKSLGSRHRTALDVEEAECDVRFGRDGFYGIGASCE